MDLNNSGEVTEMAEGARLESVCVSQGHRGFESLPLRHITCRDHVISSFSP